MNKDKKQIMLTFVATFVMLLGLIPFFILAKRHGDLQLGNWMGVSIVVILAILMTVFAMIRVKDLKKGQPVEDEFSKKVLMTASSRAFYISLYWMLAIMLFEKIFADIFFNAEKLNVEQAMGGAITGMAIIFFISWMYYNKKGTVL